MKALKIDGNGDRRKLISDELRELKQMSKGLRIKALRALQERHTAQRPKTESVVLPRTKSSPSIAA